MPKWQGRKPRTPLKVADCGPGKWEEHEHGLDYPDALHTWNFRVTGTGHFRIEQMFQDGCQERGRRFSPYNEEQPEQRVAMWICCNASSFVFFDTRGRSTTIGFERPNDAEAFKREFVLERLGTGTNEVG